MFPEVMGSIWGARKTEKQSGIPIWIQTRFYNEFGIILGIILGAKIVETSMWILIIFLEGPGGGLWLLAQKVKGS